MRAIIIFNDKVKRCEPVQIRNDIVTIKMNNESVVIEYIDGAIEKII